MVHISRSLLSFCQTLSVGANAPESNYLLPDFTRRQTRRGGGACLEEKVYLSAVLIALSGALYFCRLERIFADVA